MTVKTSKDGFMYYANGDPLLTDKGKKVRTICRKCGEPVAIYLKGEPVFMCKNGHYHGTVKFEKGDE